MAESISSRVARCLALFRGLVDPPDGAELDFPDGVVLQIIDEQSRFKVWSGNIGAHKTGMSSLDYRLRDASHIKSQVINLLKDLGQLAEDASAIARGQQTPWDQEEPGEEDFADSDSDESLDTELGQIAVDMADVVNCLLRLSVSIRNPAPHDRYIQAKSTDASHYEPFDIDHVRSKFEDIEPWLADRLGKAISRRRQYLKYRHSHHEKLSHGLDEAELDAGRVLEDQTVASSIPSHLKEGRVSSTQAQQPVLTDDASDAGMSQTSYATSMATLDRLTIPPLPKEAHDGPFQCFLCYMMIVARDRAAWKKHVYGDLQPYVCLENDCVTPEREYRGRHEWIAHVRQNHWKTYKCITCASAFSWPADCRRHFEAFHPAERSAAELDALVKLSEQPVDIQQGVSCPLCHETLRSVQQYQRHVGRHQEQLSLFALPSLDGDGEADGDDQDSDKSDVGEPVRDFEKSDSRLSWMDDQTYPPSEELPEKPEKLEEEDEEGERSAKEADEAIATYKAGEAERIQKQEKLEDLEKPEDAEELITTNVDLKAEGERQREKGTEEPATEDAEDSEEDMMSMSDHENYNKEADEAWAAVRQGGYGGRDAEVIVDAILAENAAERNRLRKEKRRERQQQQKYEAEEAIPTDDDLKAEEGRQREEGAEELATTNKPWEADQIAKQEDSEEDEEAIPSSIWYNNNKEVDEAWAAVQQAGYSGRQAEDYVEAILEANVVERNRLRKEKRRERQQQQKNEAEEAIATNDDLKTEGERDQEKGTEKLATTNKAWEVDKFEKQEEQTEDAEDAEDAEEGMMSMSDYDKQAEEVWDSLQQAGVYGRQAEDYAEAILEQRGIEKPWLKKGKRRERQQEEEDEAEEDIATPRSISDSDNGRETMRREKKTREKQRFENQKAAEATAAYNTEADSLKGMLVKDAEESYLVDKEKQRKMAEEQWERLVDPWRDVEETEAVMKKEGVKSGTEDESTEREMLRRKLKREARLAMDTAGETQFLKRGTTTDDEPTEREMMRLEMIKRELRQHLRRERESKSAKRPE